VFALALLLGVMLLLPGVAHSVGMATSAAVPWVQFHGDAASRGFNPFETIVGLNNVSSLSLTWIGDGATVGEDLVFRSSPVVGKGLVFFGTDQGQVLAFRATGCGSSSCDPVWRADLPQSIYNTPSIFQDTLFVGTASPQGRFYAFDAAGCGGFCSPTWSAPLQVGESSSKVSNGVVYVGSDGATPGLYAFDAHGCGQSTCSPMWVGTTSAVESTPAISGGFVYVAGQDGYLDVFQADGCGSSTCDPVWRGKMGAPSYGASPAVWDGLVFQPSFDGRLNVFDASGCGGNTCQPLWKGDLENYGESSPAVAKGWVFIGHHEGWLAAFKASGCGQQLCEPNWFGQPPGPVAENDSSPMVANGVVYIGSMANKIDAFKAAGCGHTSCNPLWEFITQDPIVNSSPVMDGGTLYVSGSNFGSVPQLYVFRPFAG
jgi:outer membrane protein assembly factor BamB